MKYHLLAFTLFGLLGLSVLSAAEEPYHFLKEIPIGGEGGWDYLSLDSQMQRLYVTHATKIIVIDLTSDRVTGEIKDTPGVHGFALAHDLHRGFSSNGTENKVSVVDLKTLQTLSKVETGEKPDAILYEPVKQNVYAFNGRGNSVTVIDAITCKVLATIPLDGNPEFAAVDPQAGRVYCNIEDKSEVAVIDATTHKIVSKWPLAPGQEPTGMAIDLAHHRLFIGCHNKLMVMMDSTTGKVVATVPIGAGVDATAFDPDMQLAFSSNGEGTVTIAHEETPDTLTVVQNLTTEPRARTMALDPKTHRIYLASAKFETPPAQNSDTPAPRPKIIPDTLKILVYGQKE